MDNQKREWSGYFIPAKLWHQDLSAMEILMFVEISSYDEDKGCFKSNKSLAERLKMSERNVSRIIANLKDKGFISVDTVYKKGTKMIEKRTIKALWGYGQNVRVGIDKMSKGIDKMSTPPRQNGEDSNTLNSNTISNTNNKETNKENPPSDSEIKNHSDTELFQNYIDICNEVLAIDGVKRRWRAVEGGIKRSFLARLKDGYTGKDFISAMKNAMREKNHIESGFKYLTPEFFTRVDKLERYSNMAIPVSKQRGEKDELGYYTDTAGVKYKLSPNGVDRIYYTEVAGAEKRYNPAIPAYIYIIKDQDAKQ